MKYTNNVNNKETVSKKLSTKSLVYSFQLVVIFALLPLLASCTLFGKEKIEGNGILQEYTIDVTEFSKISFGGKGSMYKVYNLSVDNDSTPKAEITIDENLFDELEILQMGDTLHIDVNDGVDLVPSSSVNISIAMNEFAGITVDGSSDIRLNSDLTQEILDLEINGSGDFECNERITLNELNISIDGSGKIVFGDGVADSQTVNIDGIGDVDSHEVESKDVKINIDGSGDVNIRASDSANISIDGSGDVYLYGNPTDVSNNISGSGDVTIK